MTPRGKAAGLYLRASNGPRPDSEAIAAAVAADIGASRRTNQHGTRNSAWHAGGLIDLTGST